MPAVPPGVSITNASPGSIAEIAVAGNDSSRPSVRSIHLCGRHGHPARRPVRGNATVVGQDGCATRLSAKLELAVAAMAGAEGPPSRGEWRRFRPAPASAIQSLRSGETTVGHMRVDGARAVEIGTGAGAAANGLVILGRFVAEGEIVHRALRRRHLAHGAE